MTLTKTHTKTNTKTKTKGEHFQENRGHSLRHSYFVLHHNYINIIFEIIFAKTKTKTKTRWDPSGFCTVCYVQSILDWMYIHGCNSHTCGCKVDHTPCIFLQSWMSEGRTHTPALAANLASCLLTCHTQGWGGLSWRNVFATQRNLSLHIIIAHPISQ